MSEAKTVAIVPAPAKGTELYRASTDAAHLCKEIVVATAMAIQGRKYVRVEGWQSIAIAHGCIASSGEVERVTEADCPGYRAIGKVIRVDTGAVIATAEGFVGDDESMWAKRPVYARRAMAQTRAISRACRSAFAHVVVMMNAGLETTPAEEVPAEGFEDKAPQTHSIAAARAKVKAAAEVLNGEVVEADTDVFTFTFGKHKGKSITEVPRDYLEWLRSDSAKKLEAGEARDPKRAQAMIATLDAELARRGDSDDAGAP